MKIEFDAQVLFWRFVGVVVVAFGLGIGVVGVMIVHAGGWFAFAGMALMLWALALVIVGAAMVIDP